MTAQTSPADDIASRLCCGSAQVSGSAGAAAAGDLDGLGAPRAMRSGDAIRVAARRRPLAAATLPLKNIAGRPQVA